MTLWQAFSATALLSTAVVYWFYLRPYLQSLPEADSIGAYLKGRREILVGIWLQVLAFLPDVLQLASGLDLKYLLGLPDLWAAWVNAMIPVIMLFFRGKREQ